jgi:hypothetical protein
MYTECKFSSLYLKNCCPLITAFCCVFHVCKSFAASFLFISLTLKPSLPLSLPLSLSLSLSLSTSLSLYISPSLSLSLPICLLLSIPSWNLFIVEESSFFCLARMWHFSSEKYSLHLFQSKVIHPLRWSTYSTIKYSQPPDTMRVCGTRNFCSNDVYCIVLSKEAHFVEN